jgi:hypothetical protein
MPAGGLIPDSPWLYYLGKTYRGIRRRLRVPKGLGRRSGTGFEFYFHKLVIYKPILNFELTNRYGMVAQHLHRRANRILMGAKAQVGVRTGALRRSLRIEHEYSPLGATVKVGSNLHYALMHHEGTRPHIITPKNPGGVLVFTKGTKLIRTQLVRHPGTKPNRYLSDQLRIEMSR